MDFDIGDLVTRNSHNNDTVFVITDIVDNVCYLKGMNVRLLADSFVDDLNKYNDDDIENECSFMERIKCHEKLDRTDYFYLPGKILHIDGDICLNNKVAKPYNIRVSIKLGNQKNHQKDKNLAIFTKN